MGEGFKQYTEGQVRGADEYQQFNGRYRQREVKDRPPGWFAGDESQSQEDWNFVVQDGSKWWYEKVQSSPGDNIEKPTEQPTSGGWWPWNMIFGGSNPNPAAAAPTIE